jgi:hypothetical protein
MSTCPHCGQDDRTDHARCAAYLADHQALTDALRGADARCADAATYVLASAPADRRLRVALAVVEAWKGDDDA